MGKQGRTTAQRASSKPQALAKIPTGVAGLDDILEGGFPTGRTTLISGGSGTGKTMLGLEFLCKSALADCVISLDLRILGQVTTPRLRVVNYRGIGFSSLIDAIILLRSVEIYTKISRSLLILKSRGAKHSSSYHRFVITDHDIEITTMPSGARLSEMQGQPSTGQSHGEKGVAKGGEQ